MAEQKPIKSILKYRKRKMPPKQIAVVGSGCAGLGAIWALKSTSHEVHLFEADDRLGGHTNTVSFIHKGHVTPVDTGFIVMNSSTYPNFLKFLGSINLKIVETEMTFGISRDEGAFEWAGNSLSSVFAQWSNLISPRHWRMIFDIIRFNQFALDLLSEDDTANTSFETMGDYLSREDYSTAFRDNYLIPMTACVWSTSPDKCSLSFPVKTLVRFLWNHHLLTTISERPPWLTIPGGTRKYLDAIMKDFPEDRIHLNTPITSITNNRSESVILHTNRKGEQWMFDEVILACHGDQALQILAASVTETEEDILGAFKTSPNTVFLHSDLSLMPRRRSTWSSWNYLTTSRASTKPWVFNPFAKNEPNGKAIDDANPSPALDKVSLTYNMNILQHIPTSLYGHVLVTMNPPHNPDPRTIQGVYEYSHPLYTPEAVAAQQRLNEIQGKRGVYFCGAWTRYGFHEDGFTSGVEIATNFMGAKTPFEVQDARYSRGQKPVLHTKDHAVRVGVGFIQMLIVMGERAWDGMLTLLMLPFDVAAWVLSTFINVMSYVLMIVGLLEEKQIQKMESKQKMKQ
ncbi:MAG: hypothetical protein M1820_010553 [Bogoriella megaspora]|nr:MAG: hypothetical protein M1820_010553 [Bogoriella megaspora]